MDVEGRYLGTMSILHFGFVWVGALTEFFNALNTEPCRMPLTALSVRTRLPFSRQVSKNQIIMFPIKLLCYYITPTLKSYCSGQNRHILSNPHMFSVTAVQILVLVTISQRSGLGLCTVSIVEITEKCH